MDEHTHEHRPMFLFGSYTSPMPKVTDVTKAVLNGNYRFHTDGRLYPGKCSAKENSIKAFIRFVYEETEATNYEDLAYIISALSKQDETDRDPIVKPFYKSIINAIVERPELQAPAELGIQFDKSEIISLARSWIAWVVHQQLQNIERKQPIDLINFFNALELKRDPAWICTLNHDLQTEAALYNLGIKFNNGFIKTETKHPRFEANEIFRTSSDSKLLKLHGSINWFWKNRKYHEVPVPLSMDDEDYINDNPAFISGSLNKLEDYTYQIYPWIWAEFQNQLSKTRRIICSGYGFKDLGVTSRIDGWLNVFPEARLLIIAPDNAEGDSNGLIENCRKERIGNIGGFFKKKAEFGNGHEYDICSSREEVLQSAAHIVVLNEKFENSRKYTDALRWFAYDSM